MSVLTSPRGKVEVVHCRRTESQDIYCIKNLIRKFTQKLFGKLNIIYLLFNHFHREKANLAVTLCNDKEEIMAQATFVDYPNWNVSNQDNWLSVFQELDSEIPCTPLNTLFMHLFVAVDEYSVGCCREIIRTVYKAVPELYFIFLIVPSYMSLGSTLITVFEQVGNIPSLMYDEDFAVHICHRHRHYPQLHIRNARVEDHDDLMPIFMRHDTLLKETYGEYFLAELIEAQDKENHAVVCEVEGVAVGFMSVCSRVNMQLLHECFDLGPFHGLCIPHPDDVLQPPEEQGIEGSQDAELSSSNPSSLKTVEEPQEPLSPEAMEIIQGRITDEAPVDDLFSAVQSGNSSEMEDIEKFSQQSTVGDTDCDGSYSSLASMLLPKETSYFRPTYKGASAAFCIQLFCIEEKYEARSLDFMNFVFSLFPDKNFCIISLPHLTPEFALIQNFVKIVPFNNCTLEQDLYVFHRAGLLKSINIRLATLLDTPGVENLVSTLMLNKSILADLKQYNEARRDPDGTSMKAFVAEVAEQIVGIAVIRDEMDIEYIRSHYNIEDFIYFSHHQREEHGHLYHFALNPIFRHYTKFFLKEILRLGYKSCLYYPVYPQLREGKFQSSSAHSLTSALHYLVPVRPRRQIVYPLEKLGINAPSKAVSKDPLSYALNHTNRKLTLEPKITVNAKIVVVGASSVGISFLETLVFCMGCEAPAVPPAPRSSPTMQNLRPCPAQCPSPHLKFSNLTLISTHGFPGKNLLGTEQRKFLASDHCFNDKDYASMSLCSWVNVVVGRMTAIDRAAKHVVVSKEEIVLYDHLILCTGQQYQVPCPTGADINQHPTNREIPNSGKQRYTDKVPRNHFTLNDEEDCCKALSWIRSNSIITEGNIIVYGNTIDTYTTVETLLNVGVRGSYIHLVQPPPTSTVTCINNYSVESAVEDALRAVGVTIHRDALLAQWNDGRYPDPIQSACFTTPTKPFRLTCCMFFSFCEKNVDYETFKALNDACLVYDSRLVIDTNFHTNDVAIRAAGSLTKFSNKYYSNEWTHSSFSSKEIGFQLAAAMLSLFDPTLEPVTEPPADLDRLIPMYKGAKIQGGILPGSYHYLHIAKPAIPTPLEVQMAQPSFGSEIVTGNAKNGTYFRIHINKYKMVETITCLSKEPFPASNYIRLFGQHEQLLNNLCARYEDKLIPDLYSYFMEPWCMALFHDRFIDLRKELRQILTSKEEEDFPSIEQLARQIEDEEISLKEKPRKYLKRVFQETIYKSLVEKSILDYLHYNHYHLPMYAWPGII
ncbi:cilia- and flagella-associated protein 61 isoform X3 [Canis lupus baileyi]|uniref:cilia- and flagella-associated protein 61 isoform X1 n=1 Tax=Canis lupus familiaris TaxID=9615 RepID=UPI0015F1A551|nr:cilia- and flagella-associated protein 61 isoform X1 [Canis lupus familiaris]XP_038288895.1 cilia- and flagella-associated protein 61 isoform X1 [Canis lupus familiaris]